MARNELGEKCYASPALSNGQIFLRSEKAIYCIGCQIMKRPRRVSVTGLIG